MPALEPVFRGHMNPKREVVLDDKQAFYIWRCHFKEGAEVELILRRRRKKRSKNQNSYLWSCVYAVIAESSGYDSTDEVHAAMKQMFLEVKRDNLPPTVRSTTELSTVEFSEYVDKIKRWASQFLGCYIPDASEVYT